MPEYTTTEAAVLLQTAQRNVQNYCKRHGLKKFGREYIVTSADLEGMKKELRQIRRVRRNENSTPETTPNEKEKRGVVSDEPR